MLITTRNSIYRLVQDGRKIVATKIKDLRVGCIPTIKVGDTFIDSNMSPIVIGEPFYISDLRTTEVMKTKREPGDDAIRFKSIKAEPNTHKVLKAVKFLKKRNPRAKKHKKPGLVKARKAKQWSKR